jgi:hypothetical protein
VPGATLVRELPKGNDQLNQSLKIKVEQRRLDSSVEDDIRDGFFEIEKKFTRRTRGQSRQMYVSHECLHQFHPVFQKVGLNTVRHVLENSAIIHLKKGQSLYNSGQTDNVIYFILFGKLRLYSRPPPTP